jgi:5-hydroxyisourate hydrolase-like protein (transthyretin family)
MSAQPLPTGRLTTHVLDTARGCPAAGLVIELVRIEGQQRHLIKTVSTNSDGRVDGPLLAGADLAVGVYELVFHAGDYLRGAGETLPGTGISGHDPHPLRHRRHQCALPCAAADLGLWLFHLSRQLTTRRGAPCLDSVEEKPWIRKKRKPRGSTSVLTRLISKP